MRHDDPRKGRPVHRTTIITGLIAAALTSLAFAPVASAKPRDRVTHAEVFAAVERQAAKTATTVEVDGGGEVSIDRSRTTVGHYMRDGAFRKSATFAIFGTKTVNGEADTVWCLGSADITRTKNGQTRVLRTLTCVGF